MSADTDIANTSCIKNKNIDIECRGHDGFWTNLHQVRSKSKDWEAK
jgi:hypothetical protein